MRQVSITSTIPPLPGCSLWHGTARTKRRCYEWFYEPGKRPRVRAEQPDMRGCWMNLRSVPTTFRVAIQSAIADTQQARLHEQPALPHLVPDCIDCPAE
ncbi:hypothetical protein ACVISU_004230 [Bradyrhizobium sp. USDA 4452]